MGMGMGAAVDISSLEIGLRLQFDVPIETTDLITSTEVTTRRRKRAGDPAVALLPRGMFIEAKLLDRLCKAVPSLAPLFLNARATLSSWNRTEVLVIIPRPQRATSDNTVAERVAQMLAVLERHRSEMPRAPLQV